MRTYQDSKTFIGFNPATQQFESTVTEVEWAIAHRELDGKPSGTKLYAYRYGAPIIRTDGTIEYSSSDEDEPGAQTNQITLSHTFIFMPGGKVCAISHDKKRLIQQTDQSEAQEKITAGDRKSVV